METWKRICIKDYTVKDSVGQCVDLQRGSEYITGSEENGRTMVFTKYWVDVPIELFAGAVRFT